MIMSELPDLSKILNGSLESIKKYVMEHPGLLIKGVPLVFVIWLAYPLILTTWGWLPWVWASYETYKMLPEGILNTAFKEFLRLANH